MAAVPQNLATSQGPGVSGVIARPVYRRTGVPLPRRTAPTGRTADASKGSEKFDPKRQHTQGVWGTGGSPGCRSSQSCTRARVHRPHNTPRKRCATAAIRPAKNQTSNPKPKNLTSTRVLGGIAQDTATTPNLLETRKPHIWGQMWGFPLTMVSGYRAGAINQRLHSTAFQKRNLTMAKTSYVVRVNNPDQNFTMIRNELLEDENLSADAVGVACWLLKHHDGHCMLVSRIKSRFKIGKDRWQRIARELRAAGYLRAIRLVGENGRVTGWTYEMHSTPVLRKPPTYEDETVIDQKPAKPASGKSTENHRPENPATGPDYPAYKDGKTGSFNKQTARGATSPRTKDAPRAQQGQRNCYEKQWRKAETAAQNGLRWLHPETGEWHSPQNFLDERNQSEIAF